jgi:hypothetical protein
LRRLHRPFCRNREWKPFPVKARPETNTPVSRKLPRKRALIICLPFLQTARSEQEHARIWYEKLGNPGSTAENLLHAAEGENYEWTDMYV